MNTVTIETVTDPASAARTLVELRERVYADDPWHRPAAEMSVHRDLVRRRFRVAFLAAGRQGKSVAFVAARVSPDLTGPDGRPMGLLGPFEALDDTEAAVALLRAGVERLRGLGAGEIVGPMSGDTWHSYRVNVGPYEDPPFLLEPYNPAWEAAQWESAGFEVIHGYHTKRVEQVAALAEQLGPKRAAAQAQGYRFQPFRLEHFEEELGRVYELSRELFAANPLYVEIPRPEFIDLYRDARPLIDPECAAFAVAPDGTDAGFVFALPDPTGVINVKTLGVQTAHRRAGLGGALTSLSYRVAADRGLGLNLCLMHDDNVSSRLDGGRSRILRRYHLYRWAGTDVAP
jgi:ribosomal protein S18 acetylase RimI-like enzyme